MSEPVIREIKPGEDAVAYPAIVELRPVVGSLEQFLTIIERQRERGYRMVGVFEEGVEDAAAVIGFSTGQKLAWGSYLYVEDTSTHPEHQRKGHANKLFEWIIEEAKRLDVDGLHLDSGVQRHGAHRLYIRSGLRISSHHFQLDIKK